MKFCKGSSLLEVVFVIAVIAVVLVASIDRYQKYQFEAKVNQVSKSVDLLQQALGEYFFQHCHDSSGLPLGPKSAKDFLQYDLTSKANFEIDNPLGQDFQVIIKSVKDAVTGVEVYQLMITAVINKQFNIKDYMKILNASGCADAAGQPQASCSDNRLVWQKSPWYEAAGRESNLWVLKGGLMQFYQQQNSHPDARDVCLNKQMKQ